MEKDILAEVAPPITVEYRQPHGMVGVFQRTRIDPKEVEQFKKIEYPLRVEKVRVSGGRFELLEERERVKSGVLGRYVVSSYGQGRNEVLEVVADYVKETRLYEVLLDRSVRMRGVVRRWNREERVGDETAGYLLGRVEGGVFLEEGEVSVIDYDWFQFKKIRARYPVLTFIEARLVLPIFDLATNSFRLPE